MSHEKPYQPASTGPLIPERLVDAGLCIALVIVSTGLRGTSIAAIVELAVAVALVLGRRRWPIASLACGLLAAITATALAQMPTVLLPACVILVFNVAVWTNRRTTATALVAALVAVLVCIAILTPDQPLMPALLAGIAWPTLAAAAGEATRSRAEIMVAAIERAERAEITREQEARRRVAEERLHIARELHDLVAHNMAVVNVQAGVAEHFLTEDPPAAGSALRQVRASARAVLDELAGILSILRSDDDPDSPLTPLPTIDDIPILVASFRSAGMEVSYETSGAHRPLSASATLTAYRTAQEALANALKHGTGTVRLLVVYEPEHLRMVAENPIDPSSPSSTSGSGYGLTGMHERLNTAGGTLATSTLGNAFRLDVTIPYTSDTPANGAHGEAIR